MSWMHCGQDSKGRDIGYGIPAVCDHPECSKPIDRGLGHACGGMHGAGEGCEGYFCADHLTHHISDNLAPSIYGGRVCGQCHVDFVKENGPICPVCDGDGCTGLGGEDLCQSCDGDGLVKTEHADGMF